MKNTNDIRKAFLDFFARNGHEVRPSSSLVPLNDPTLMFANAGMNQFKNVFTGAEKLPFSRAATSQKCVRAGGKHNDLDNVGYTARHHTFFEMLGNFSFGDYFKEEAINYAWELLTKDYGLNKDKLCVTVYHDDDVAWNHWKKITGFADHRIIRINTNDNFWSMGDTGPCGPCSEIFYDHGDHIKGGPPGSADADGDRFVEIWNLVFMQYEQVDEKTRINLPKPSIDTGMGLERLAAVMQGVTDNYDIDLFKGIIADIKAEAGKIGGQTAKDAAAYKVIADHLRSSCFLIADGVMPSNEGRGYVLRRIMRRAMRYAHQLGCRDPLMYRLVPSLITQMGGAYPELARAKASIEENLRQEEERFKQTLDRGLKLLEEETAKVSSGKRFSGEAAFKLYDTFGFPLDLTQDMLRAKNIEVDIIGFEKCMDQQREMARAAHKGSGDTATSRIWFAVKEKTGATEFLGYDADEAEGKVLAIVKDGAEVTSANPDDEVYVVLDKTPFYGESGGQVGDTGEFKAVAKILDTQKPVEDLIIHHAKLTAALKVGDAVHAVIDTAKRNATRSNHSATHLLHKALRDALGEHVTQKGSLVDPNRLRFDFSHPKGVTPDEMQKIEAEVNDVVWRNTPVACKVMSPDDAIKEGAMALFGEKYGDSVRVLSMGEKNGKTYSVELCGGTHVRATGDIGLFKIASEGSVASGIRRIEAVTGENVREYLSSVLAAQQEQVAKLTEDNAKLIAELFALGKKQEAATLAKAELNLAGISARDLLARYDAAFETLQKNEEILREHNKKLSKELADAKKQAALASGGEVKPEMIGNIKFIGKIFDGLDAKDLRGIADEYLRQLDPGIVFIASRNEGKASIIIGVDQFLTQLYNSVTLLQAAVAIVGGKGGGGKPTMAQGGGPDGSKLEEALAALKANLSGQKAA
ncbi:MAG: alanine--tRNA ligase [Alphaproteobacteria bacterium]